MGKEHKTSELDQNLIEAFKRLLEFRNNENSASMVKNEIEKIKAFVNEGANINVMFGSGTALMKAAHVGYRDIVKDLIEIGVDVNVQNQKGYTALHYAALKDNFELVKELLAAGADPSLITNDGYTALQLANKSVTHGSQTTKLLETSQGLESKSPRKKPVSEEEQEALNQQFIKVFDEAMKSRTYDVYQNAVKRIQEYVSRGFNLNIQIRVGQTALMTAVINGRADFAQELIKMGADLSTVNQRNGFTALHYAALRNRVTSAKNLLEAGANISLKTQDGKTALELASEFVGDESEIHDLLKKESRKALRQDANRAAAEELAPEIVGHNEGAIAREISEYLGSDGDLPEVNRASAKAARDARAVKEEKPTKKNVDKLNKTREDKDASGPGERGM